MTAVLLGGQDLAVAGVGSSLEPLCVTVPVVPAQAPIAAVDRLFAADRGLSAVIVELPDRAALLPRDHVQFELSGRFGYGRSLHFRATAADLLPTDTLVVSSDLPLTETAQRILDRPPQSRYRDILVHTVTGPQVVPVSAVFERLAEMFHHVALHDPLTGLPNRRLMERYGADLARRGVDLARIAILYIDLDGFKAVNDTFGHRAGDEVLVAFAERLRTCVRPSDVVARLGGDEFAVMLIDVSAVHASAIADRIVLTATAPFVYDDEPLYLSASVGIAMASDVARETELTPLDVLLRHADAAMLAAKRAGKRQVGRLPAATDPTGSAPARAAVLHRRLRAALTNGDLHLHYQPMLDLATGSILAVEALLRWADPELGPVAPAEFIPVAEQSGQIHRLGHWVIHEACRQAAHWHAAGTPRTVAINTSPVQFANDRFVADLLTAVAEYALPPGTIRIEITEGTAVSDLPRTIARLTQLRAAGVGVDLDDFGTGHSSLAMLRALPLSAVKIDKSFIDELDTDPADRLLVKGVIGAAHALGLTVTAEGVERSEQLTALRTMGCDTIQGYLIARPAPAAELDQPSTCGR